MPDETAAVRQSLAARILPWLPALLGMGILFYTSSLPGDEIHLPDFRFSDKVVHALAYACLGWLISLRHSVRRRMAREEAPAPWKGRDLAALAIGILYGVSDEIHQLFVPGRQFDFSDMAADALGVAVGVWLYRKLMLRAPVSAY